MARRVRSQGPVIESREFGSVDEIQRGIGKLRRRIRDLQSLDPTQIPYDDATVGAVMSNIRETIRDVFGQNSPEFYEHQHHRISHGGLNIYDTDEQRQQKFAAGIPQTVTMLSGLIARLEEKAEDLKESQVASIQPAKAPPRIGRKVFVVHGHDDAVKERVVRFLSALELEPVILHELPNQGRTIIEKFEEETQVDYAIVLLTPDDSGQLADSSVEAQPRARQNVIFELGFFIAKIGRDHVCALYTGNVELPSDYSGVLYIPMDDAGGWQLLVARELTQAGLPVDLNKVV